MPLPTPLLRQKSSVNKNDFGHVLVLAGSPHMLGAACLTSLAAIRTGAGLVTAGIPKSLNLTLQAKISHAVMTLSLPETKEHTFALEAADIILKQQKKYSAIALGPGLSRNPSTISFARKLILNTTIPMVIDADALNALAGKTSLLLKARGVRILTPHEGEMARISGIDARTVSQNRADIARRFAIDNNCVVVLKGHNTIISSTDGKISINKTGNPGMATAGSGDVLTGIIAGLIAQRASAFDAAQWGAKLHGEAADHAIKRRNPAGLIATDIIDSIMLKRKCAC